MAVDSGGKKRHFILEGLAMTEPYGRPGRGARTAIPERDRQQHSASLLGQLLLVEQTSEAAVKAQAAAGLEDGLGIRVEFESFPDVELAFESLVREPSGIELLNVQCTDGKTAATVFVPDGKLVRFERLIRAYLENRRDRNGKARDNKRLVNAIQAIRAATLESLWTDDRGLFPLSEEETLWWEVWLPVRGDRPAPISTFRELAAAQGVRVAKAELTFPERTVLLAHASRRQMVRSMLTLNSIAELRRAKETAEFFDSLPSAEQPAWLDELLTRSRFAPASDLTPHVCILDTGVNRGHPLLSPALGNEDVHTVEPGWGSEDAHGHGTRMAGLALAGPLGPLLEATGPVTFQHRLESVKVLRGSGEDGGDALHHGYITGEAVARPEITAPRRRRVFSLAITARDDRDRGRPSAWSAALDRLAADAEGSGAHPRLIAVSAGNVEDASAWLTYPASNESDGVHDPGQAWNVLTVGAYTDLTQITEAEASGFLPVAPQGGLSPFSTTSLTWESHWPHKPDIVLEGGNAARDANYAFTTSSLSLLTTHYRPTERLFSVANATSAATALAAQIAAQIMAVYPELWPETVRGLIVHSAEWTDRMRQMWLASAQPSKVDYERLVRRCGFGVPSLERALWSAANSLTMVVQGQLHPFRREPRKAPGLREMQLYQLPWPSEALEALGEVEVDLRVTLSYFIEPNPSRRGVRSRYRYESHGLRFDVKRPGESTEDFRRRINAAARDEEEGTPTGGGDSKWLVGPQKRHRGSLHCDVWRGTAVELASRGALAVFPAAGWWKTRPKLERYDRIARYALILSISAPSIDVDLYSEVANQVGLSIAVET